MVGIAFVYHKTNVSTYLKPNSKYLKIIVKTKRVESSSTSKDVTSLHSKREPRREKTNKFQMEE